MNISVGNSAQITTGRDSEKEESFLNVRQVASGFGFALELYGRFLLCRKTGLTVPVIVATPSPRWDQDLIDEGYEIIKIIGFKAPTMPPVTEQTMHDILVKPHLVLK